MNFGKGLLPDEAKAEFRPGWLQCNLVSNRFFKLDVGLAYINAVSEEYGYSFALGLDFDPKSFKRETLNPLFWRALLAEFVGTAILLYVTLTSAVYGGPVIDTSEITTDSEASDTVSRIASLITNSNERFITSWVFGLTIFLLIYTYSPISGGHFNPAITWGLAVTKKVTVARAVLYTVAQLGGSVVGVLLAKKLDSSFFDKRGGGTNGVTSFQDSLLGPQTTANEAFIAEVIGTFFLLTVVYATVDPQRSNNTLHISALGPLAIGMAITVCHLFLIPIDGCSVNPARSFGPALVANSWRDHWVFWWGPLAGALLAALVNETVFKGRKGFEAKWAK